MAKEGKEEAVGDHVGEGVGVVPEEFQGEEGFSISVNLLLKKSKNYCSYEKWKMNSFNYSVKM